MLLILRDIREAKRVSDGLETANHPLKIRVVEVERMQGLQREQTSRDVLTGP